MVMSQSLVGLAAVSVVVAPEAQSLDDLLLVQNLVHEPVLDVDAP